ncbi:Lipase [Psilocybe cubensis]|uniref:Lipase n=2 Tax=Psilocybe cubensis TaxID=181762 RepID=A0ACB8GTJ4_PSICU|nr:Lipase [Psilocybe cubensis]KAH9479043.1 Lipase [Psilocybe cubensis]
MRFLRVVTSICIIIVSCLKYTAGSPTGPTELLPRQNAAITPLTKAQIAEFKPFTYFAAAGYCTPAQTAKWNCGATCKANKDFIPIASDGDGSTVQYWYVGYSPSLESVIVGHQGTNISDTNAALTDTQISMTKLDPTLFPGVNPAIEVHSGFATVQAKTATTILKWVKKGISAHSAKKVTIVGHSLGGALALLDGVYLPLHITGVTFRVIGYGMPRVGNQNFAKYVDNHIKGKQLTRINNREDPVPTVPGIYLGYHHPSGEVHITDDKKWLACPGQDNPSTQCSTGDVPNVFVGNVADHHGPYGGVSMDC